MNEVMEFTAVDENGVEKNFEVLLTFEHVLFNKKYIVYTDNTEDEDGNTRIYASIFISEDSTELKPIETQKEWEMIAVLLERIKNGEMD